VLYIITSLVSCYVYDNDSCIRALDDTGWDAQENAADTHIVGVTFVLED
jgi:hypothetical protein